VLEGKSILLPPDRNLAFFIFSSHALTKTVIPSVEVHGSLDFVTPLDRRFNQFILPNRFDFFLCHQPTFA